MPTLLLTRSDVEALLDPTALASALRDLVAAWLVYGAARARGVGREIDLLA